MKLTVALLVTVIIAAVEVFCALAMEVMALMVVTSRPAPVMFRLLSMVTLPSFTAPSSAMAPAARASVDPAVAALTASSRLSNAPMKVVPLVTTIEPVVATCGPVANVRISNPVRVSVPSGPTTVKAPGPVWVIV